MRRIATEHLDGRPMVIVPEGDLNRLERTARSASQVLHIASQNEHHDAEDRSVYAYLSGELIEALGDNYN